MIKQEFTLKIDLGNAAFGPTPADRNAEISRILRKLAERIENVGAIGMTAPVRDLNGGNCGAWDISDFAFAHHGETDPDEEYEEDDEKIDPDRVQEVTCIYGRGSAANCFVLPDDNGGAWYAIEGSQNVNYYPDDSVFVHGGNVEELLDTDTFTASAPINSAADMARECEGML